MASTPSALTYEPPTESSSSSFITELFDRCEQLLKQHRAENADLYRIVDLKKKAAANSSEVATDHSAPQANTTAVENNTPSVLDNTPRGPKLRALIQESHRTIRTHVLETNADIIPRTQAHNRKSSHHSLEEESEYRADLVSAQIRAWRSLLPNLIKRFSRIPDYRRVSSVKHTITVLMAFGLFAFIFRLSSRREMNRELTSPVIIDHLKKLFPELETIPHADTLARALENIAPREIERIHIRLIKELIKKKKFKKLLIQNCIPITIDGTQKLYRQGVLQDETWCERKVGAAGSDDKQQYIYTLEANITLKNGLSIPLMTEYLYRNNNALENDFGKQDSETTAFERLSERLKKYFPRLKIMMLMDAMFATQSVMGILHEYHWEYIICLPKKKLTTLAKCLNDNKKTATTLPEQTHYRKRKQTFYWENNIAYGYEWQLNINLIACSEEYESVNKKTGEIETCYSEHSWISSIPADINNLHELLNLGARKKELIEDSFNTGKNRGYHYKHAFSYNWNAMQGFHYLMRLAHAINAISEFTKALKKYVKDLGCSPTLKLIKETLFSPWLPLSWYEEQVLETPQLRLQLE